MGKGKAWHETSLLMKRQPVHSLGWPWEPLAESPPALLAEETPWEASANQPQSWSSSGNGQMAPACLFCVFIMSLWFYHQPHDLGDRHAALASPFSPAGSHRQQWVPCRRLNHLLEVTALEGNQTPSSDEFLNFETSQVRAGKSHLFLSLCSGNWKGIRTTHALEGGVWVKSWRRRDNTWRLFLALPPPPCNTLCSHGGWTPWNKGNCLAHCIIRSSLEGYVQPVKPLEVLSLKIKKCVYGNNFLTVGSRRTEQIRNKQCLMKNDSETLS